MDPLSVAASITGLLTASIEVAKLFAAFMDAYDYARTVYDEIQHFRFILYRLDKYIQSRSINIARASMIDLDQVVTVLMGSMFTFSELEREVKRLQSRPEGLRRMWWTMAKSNLVDLIQRLQNHKGTICSMLLILTNDSQDEALHSMGELQRQVAELVRINAEMARKLDLAIGGSVSSSGASIAASTMTTQSALSFSSARTDFVAALNKSRVYRRALLGRVINTKHATEHTSAPSIQQSWSILSGISLSEVSNYAVFSLPIAAQELYNPIWYTNPGPIVGLDPSMPEISSFLTLDFVGDLKTALKQNDVEAARSIANYIPWNLALKLSAIYPKLAADASDSHGELLDSLTLFRLWLKCGGNPEIKDQHGQTAIVKAMEDDNRELFKLLVQNRLDVYSTWHSKTALHLVLRGGNRSPLGLYDDSEGTAMAEIDLSDYDFRNHRGWAVKVLLEAGVAVNARDDYFRTALHYASEDGHKDVVEILLEHGADIEASDHWKMNALHYSSQGGHVDVVELLLKNGGDIKAIDHRGMNAFRFALKGRHSDVTEVLYKHEANIDLRHYRRMNALDFALERGHEDVVDVSQHWQRHSLEFYRTHEDTPGPESRDR